jgi:ABC-type branched-subunit amino acid transport system permease subunit
LEPLTPEMQALWTGGNAGQQEAEKKSVSGTKYQYLSLWWYVMLLALVVAVAETALSSRYLGTQREEI